ncbi:hypothetical protein HWV62_38881 [Athelia sp. TMB]|nr:hypothetical protein HWV62_38881 [Athelia sp. TMB]
MHNRIQLILFIKFKIDTLTQQLQLAQSEAERTSSELNDKTEEFAKYRRTKHTEHSQLQAEHDALTQSHSSTESSLKALQSQHLTQSHQLTQALGKVRDLTGQLAELETTYESEASGLRKLVTMMEDREARQKESVDAIERDWAGVGERAQRREAALLEEIEREKRAKEEARAKVDQLESVLDKVGRGELPMPGRGLPGTPARTSDHLTEGMMGLSPTVAMASKAQRTGKTFTEVYADYVRLQDDYAKKSAEYDHMDRTLGEVLAQIEERAPILSQQRMEYERLQSEAAQLAQQLSQALADRDAYAHNSHETSQKLARSARENDLLQKQLNDLGRQVQHLLKEIGRRDDPTIPTDEDLASLAPPAENIEAVITSNLVLFRSIGDLQEQNQKLLKIVRELGDKMEAEEQDYRAAMEKEQAEAVREAHEAMQALAKQLETQQKGSEIKIQAYMKERDALKTMLARAERSSTSSSSIGGVESGLNGFHEPQLTGSQADMSRELAEIHNQFELYRTEMGVDSAKLREEAIAAQREAGQLNAALAKANAKIEYLTDRHRISQDQFAMQNRELENLTKRNAQLYDQYTRLDIECNRATEDFLAANSRTEQLRNECANLRAEKNIWESVQARLVDDNKSLAVERAHLSDLMTNVQKMHNDLERSGENDRRRLESQMQMLETQTSDLKMQLAQERDSVRHLTLQKDVELKELQSRLDRSMQDLSKTRESLIGAETSRSHLQARVEELSRHLQGNEEKLSVYERRSTTVAGLPQGTDKDSSREQQFEAEVAELRSALKVAEVDLATARSHVQQFQEISQANESALATLNASHDEYKASTEAQINKHELEYKALEDKLRYVQEEAQQLHVRHAELQRTLDTERSSWLADKRTLEDTIVDLSTSEKDSESNRTLRENDARQQEERATAAEERYTREVIAHAESIKSIESLKQQLSAVQVASRDNLVAAETAAAKLAASENSWKQQKQALDKEMSDLNARCKDLSSQNAILHQHLESVSSQATRIQQASDASTNAATDEVDATEDTDTKLSELRSVVSYLRREKEIVDLQLELSKQENVRLKSQIEHLSQSLEETRASLSEERERAVEAAASEAQHAELVERINQLNILRESNATLRADCENYSKRSRDLEAKLKALSAELEPAKEQARVSQAELEARDVQVKRLEAESKRWQDRNAQLLSKYDRIDPAEVQSLKDQIEQLQTEKAALSDVSQGNEEEKKKQLDRTTALEESVRNHRTQLQKVHTEFRSRWATANTEKQLLQTTITELRSEIEVLTANLNSQVESLRLEKSALENSLAAEKASKEPFAAVEPDAEMAALREERDRLLSEKESWVNSATSNSETAPTATTDEAKLAWEAEKAELIKARDQAANHAKASAAREHAQKAIQDAKSVRLQNEKFQTRLQDLQKARAADNERQQAAISAAVEKTKAELGQASGPSTESTDVTKAHAEELRALEERLTAEHQKQLEAALAAAKKAHPAATASLSDADQKAAIAAAIEAHEKEAEPKRQAEIKEAMDNGRKEAEMKGRVKDAQLLRAQTKLKEKEALILSWQNAGLVPKDTPATPAKAATSAGAPAAAGAISAVTPSAPAATAGNSALPAKPATANAATASASTATSQATRGRGAPRGQARGVTRGLSIRGAAPGRGGAPAASAVAAAAPGVSIIGAAGKRGREDGESPTDDSLAKRLKPAADGTASKPVTLRRPPPTT